jgi:hypothetical protein
MDKKTIFVLMQHYLNRPIKAKSPDSPKHKRFMAKIQMPMTKHVDDETVKARPPEEWNVPMDLQFDDLPQCDGEMESRCKFYQSSGT